MNLSPKVRANIAGCVVVMPVFLGRMLYDNALSQRAWMYLSVAVGLAAALIYQWVYHRHVAEIPASALPRAELSLARERLPRIVWLALGPPVLIMGLLWWVMVHGAALPWRDTWLGSPRPASEHEMFLFTTVALIAFTSLASWQVVYSLARWHGMARAYPHRRERLQWAVASQWLILVVMLAWISGMHFRMPTALATTCGIVFGTGMSLVMWMGWKLQDMRNADLPTGSWCYADFRDPTFFGPRGLNLANGWSWILAAAAVAPVVLVEWLLHAARSQP